MSFGLHVEQHGPSRRVRSSNEAVAPLTAIAIVFVAFCIFDYSPYGHGFVSGVGGAGWR